MEGSEMPRPGPDRHAEDLHRLRLTSVLHELVRERAEKGAAEALGVDARTVAAGMAKGEVTRRLENALERRLAVRDGAELLAQRARIDDLEQQVRDLADSRSTATGVGEPRAAGRNGRRRVRPDDGADGTDAGERVGVVALEPWEGEEAVHGAAMPVIAAWRRARSAGRGTRLERLAWRVRALGLELELLEGHGLTLPPAREPLHPAELAGEAAWRRRALVALHRERLWREAVRWVRRGLTLGFWWR